MPITAWPPADRPREKLLNRGADHLTDTELLAILLKSGIHGKSALDIARELIKQHGDLKTLLSLEQHQLTAVRGIGLAKLAYLKACLELGRRVQHTPFLPGTTLNSSKLTQAFTAQQLRESKNEVFACLFLDNRYRLIKFEKMFFGTINEASVYPREIVRRGLALNAANVILTHNHPSGQPLPSKADKVLTAHITQALALVDIRVTDHIIVGNPDTFSFAEAGLIKM